MKVLQINSVYNYGSTGKIVENINNLLQSQGYKSYIAYGRITKSEYLNRYRICSTIQNYINGLEARLLDNDGFGIKVTADKLIEYIKEIKPDIIHLHNLHGYYLNIYELITFLKTSQIPAILTLHDCWTFTGHCAHFDYIKCEKWKSQCNRCPQIGAYPASLFVDRSSKNFKLKKELFADIDKLIIVSVSDWLDSLVSQSFLKDKKRIVIKNGIDIQLFRPYNSRNEIIKEYKIDGKNIILSVASIWGKRKGLNDILKIANILGKDYSFIIVGGRINKSAYKYKNITIIERTENQEKLAQLYSAADIFLNPTYEDNLPTTNIEAIACGTPVLTYNTGGSPEIIDKDTGFVVEKGDIEGICNILKNFTLKDKAAMAQKCRERAERYFNKDERFMDYIKLYEKVLKGEL